MRRRAAVLISGRGSNMLSLLAASHGADFPAEIVLVASNRPDAPGLRRTGDVPALAIDHREFGAGDAGRAAHERAIDRALSAHGVELVCLAGYLRRLTPFLVERWQGRMMNIHPSLLPAFPGLDTHARALRAGVMLHGCTVHLVTEDLDAGPILAQAAVPVLPGDTAEALAARVLTQEHLLYPTALARLAAGGAGGPYASETDALCNPPPPAALAEQGAARIETGASSKHRGMPWPT